MSHKALITSDSSSRQTSRFGRIIHEDEIKVKERELREMKEEKDREFTELRSKSSRLESELKELRKRKELRRQKLRNPKFNYDSSNPFSGIIAHLNQQAGGNVHQKGVVNITSSSGHRNRCYNLVDYGWNDYWKSQSSPNSWVMFDFKEKKVSLSSYSLKSDGSGKGGHLLQWKLEGSNDGSSWTCLDSRNTLDLNGQYIVKNYSTNNHDSHRYIRITQTGKNSGNSDKFCLYNIEFFGTLY